MNYRVLLSIWKQNLKNTSHMSLFNKIRYTPMLLKQNLEFQREVERQSKTARASISNVNLGHLAASRRECCDALPKEYEPGVTLTSLSELESGLKQVASDMSGEYYVCESCGQFWKNTICVPLGWKIASDHVYKFTP
jgi:hypothetical protein